MISYIVESMSKEDRKARAEECSFAKEQILEYKENQKQDRVVECKAQGRAVCMTWARHWDTESGQSEGRQSSETKFGSQTAGNEQVLRVILRTLPL